MKFKKTDDEDLRIGITPLIDIVFLLLIFFMLTSHFHVASGISIKLPESGRKVHDNRDSRIVLVVDPQGNVYFEGKKTPLKDLGPAIRDIVEESGMVNLLLQADKRVSHGRVVEIMDLSKQAGVSSVIIAAQWEPKRVY